jgi:isopentenyl-diphosphate delta-isomerase
MSIVDESSDVLILVDEADRDVGQSSKAACHDGVGLLHRAFSLLVFNPAGELLIQQRASSKRLWPLYWSNSCCSHPRVGESMQSATQRRLREELGISCPLEFLFKFQYHARFDDAGSEHELCSVFIGSCPDAPSINREEISNWRWVSPDMLHTLLTKPNPMKFTPWFKLEWLRIWDEHRDAVLGLRMENSAVSKPSPR